MSRTPVPPSARALAPAAALLLLLSACAARTGAPQAAGPAAGANDPFEATNRKILDFNWKVDGAVYRPVALFYRRAVGPWTRARVRNVLTNLNEPAVAANALLQARPLAAGTSIMRFAINSTLGLGGLFDLQGIGGPPSQAFDFGQTLYRWGLPDGPFLMVPFLGPSTPRELAGDVADTFLFLNPVTRFFPFEANAGRFVALGLDDRERSDGDLEEIRNNSLDPYARLRSLWRQHRDAQLGVATAETPEVLEDPEAAGNR